MKDLDKLKKETANELRAARERRLDRQAKERRDGPIMDAFDRMSRGESIEHRPGSRHAPRLEAMQGSPNPTQNNPIESDPILNARAAVKP